MDLKLDKPLFQIIILAVSLQLALLQPLYAQTGDANPPESDKIQSLDFENQAADTVTVNSKPASVLKPLYSEKGPHFSLWFQNAELASALVIQLIDGRIKISGQGSLKRKAFRFAESLNEEKGFIDFAIVKDRGRNILFAIKPDYSLYAMDLQNSWLPAQSFLGRWSKISGRLYQLNRTSMVPGILFNHKWQDETGQVFSYQDMLINPVRSCDFSFR
jgi:hypothetical protein